MFWNREKNKATVVAPCARQEQVFGIYGPERGGGGWGGRWTTENGSFNKETYFDFLKEKDGGSTEGPYGPHSA